MCSVCAAELLASINILSAANQSGKQTSLVSQDKRRMKWYLKSLITSTERSVDVNNISLLHDNIAHGRISINYYRPTVLL